MIGKRCCYFCRETVQAKFTIVQKWQIEENPAKICGLSEGSDYIMYSNNDQFNARGYCLELTTVGKCVAETLSNESFFVTVVNSLKMQLDVQKDAKLPHIHNATTIFIRT